MSGRSARPRPVAGGGVAAEHTAEMPPKGGLFDRNERRFALAGRGRRCSVCPSAPLSQPLYPAEPAFVPRRACPCAPPSLPLRPAKLAPVPCRDCPCALSGLPPCPAGSVSAPRRVCPCAPPSLSLRPARPAPAPCRAYPCAPLSLPLRPAKPASVPCQTRPCALPSLPLHSARLALAPRRVCPCALPGLPLHSAHPAGPIRSLFDSSFFSNRLPDGREAAHPLPGRAASFIAKSVYRSSSGMGQPWATISSRSPSVR